MKSTKLQNWSKQGLIYSPLQNKSDWITHSQLPVVDYCCENNTFKIYFSNRDKENRSLPAYIIVSADDPKVIHEVANQPILNLGNLGTFDDCGVMPSSIVNYNSKKYLYYIGWNVRNTISYHNSVGLAISEDNGKNFKKYSEGPLWERSINEPHYSGTSEVIFEDGIWKNWYLSCVGWSIINEKPEPRYHIKYAESSNGVDWKREGKIAIDFKSDDEGGIVRASIIKDEKYKMWYSYRKLKDYRTNKLKSYRIGYAESENGIDWKRLDELVDLPLSSTGWDSEMTAYPNVIKLKDRTLMFYNGNGFGKSGIGYAILNNQ